VSAKGKILLVLCFVGAAAVLAVMKPRVWDSAGKSTPSTYSSRPAGCKALYLVLDELKLPLKRFRQSLSRLPGNHGVLVITGPGVSSFRRREMERLEQWIKDGNRLVLCDGFVKAPSSDSRREAGTKESPERSETRRPFSPSAYFRLRLDRLSDRSRSTLVVPLPGMKGAARISASRMSRWKKPSQEWTSLVTDEAGPLLLTRTMGKGAVFALADPSLLSNADLGREQNLRLILALLLASGRPDAILFDEFHQGHALERTLGSYLASSGFSWVLLQVMVGMGLFFLSQRARLAGSFRTLTAPAGRSSLEYVDSMARVYESCKAAPLALDAILARFLGQVSRRAGIPMKKLSESSPVQVAVWARDEHGNLAKVLEECRRVIKTGKGNDEPVSAARKLAQAARAVGLRGKRT
jgi:hypothetical protein